MRPAVIISVKNEEVCIDSTVRSARPIGPVFVVDSGSTDRTVEIAREAGATVVDYAWDGKYPKKKQWCLNHVGLEHDWVLFLDGDESASDLLVDEIRRLDPDVGLVAFDIELDYHWLGKSLRHGYTVTKRSLMKRTRVRFPEIDDLDAPGMGELEGHYQPQCDGRVELLCEPIIHDDRDPFSTWLDRHNRYSTWQAHVEDDPRVFAAINVQKSRNGRRLYRLPGRGVVVFVYSYLYKRGFLDGRAGFDYAFGNLIYYWMVSVKRRELRLAAREEPRIGRR